MSANASGLPSELYLTTEDFCDKIGISKSSAERMRLAGNGPAFIKLGKGRTASVRYRLSDVEAWLRANTFASTSEVKP